MLDHLDDIASDLSAFHRVDDMLALAGPMFFKLVWRLPCYAGAMQQRVLAEQEASVAPNAGASSRAYGQDINPGTQATLMAAPEFAGVFSFG